MACSPTHGLFKLSKAFLRRLKSFRVSQVLANSRVMADKLTSLGYKLVSGGTDNHLVCACAGLVILGARACVLYRGCALD
jgi:glycine/serine hydroxymethyltransferase